MSELFQPQRPEVGPGCLSELELDRLLADDPDSGLRRRLAACAHCQERLAVLAAERRARMTPDHVAGQAAAILARLAQPADLPVRRRVVRRWVLGAPVAALAAAAVLLVLLWPRRSADGPVTELVRIKGSPTLEVVLAAPGPQRVLVDGEALPAGATLSFRAECPLGCSVALFAVGAHGIEPIADVLPPPWRLSGRAPELLPVSVTLDQPPGDDLVVGFLCREPHDLALLLAALERTYGATHDLRARPPSVPGCETRSHLVRQSAPTP